MFRSRSSLNSSTVVPHRNSRWGTTVLLLAPFLFERYGLIELEVLRLGAHVLQGGTGVEKANSLRFIAQNGRVRVTKKDALHGNLGRDWQSFNQTEQAVTG